MADMAKVLANYESIGRAARMIVVAQRASVNGFLRGFGNPSADSKALAAYHPYAPPRKKFLRITKSEVAFFMRLPASSPENLLGRQGHRHFGDWRVEVVEDDRPLLLESFDEYDDALAYVARVLATVGDESAEDEHEYASVGEVPC